MQNKVSEFNKKKNFNQQELSPSARLLDIQSELGELSKEYLKHSNYGSSDFLLEEHFKLEFGDVLYSLLSLADELKLDANECLDKVILKYTSRIENKGSMDSGN